MAALSHFNDRAIKPVDAAGRLAKNKKLIEFLDRLQFTNASEDLQEEWYHPDDETKLYRSPGGHYFLTYAASKRIL